MKRFILIIYFFGLLNSNYGQKTYDRAIVYSSIEVKQGSSEGQVISETESKTLLGSNLLKIISNTNSMETQVLINRAENNAVTYIQLLGKKIGFSLITNNATFIDTFDVVIIDSNKIVNGFNCNLAKIIYKKTGERRKSAIVWYSSEYKFTDITMGVNVSGIEKIPGFPIQIQTMLPQAVFLNYTVNKIDIDAILSPNEFIVPKDVTIYKSVEEFQKNIALLQRGGN